MATIDDAHKIRWQAICKKAPWNPTFGIEAFFKEHPEIGSPLTVNEGKLDDGRAFRVFTNAIVAFGENGAEIVQ